MKTDQKINILVLQNAMNNCIESENWEWYEKHKDKIEEYLLEVLPHGSGIDGDWSFDIIDKAIFCRNSYHRMDGYGYYCGWIDFTIKIKADYRDMWGNIIFSVSGRFGKYQDLKDYLYEIVADSLSQEGI